MQDLSVDLKQIRQAADFLSLQPPQFPKFHVSAVGIVPGDQTVARAELFAVLRAAKQANLCEPVPRVEFVTDASSVCHVVNIIETGHFVSVPRKFSNGDLIQELSGVWHSQKFSLPRSRVIESLTLQRMPMTYGSLQVTCVLTMPLR